MQHFRRELMVLRGRTPLNAFIQIGRHRFDVQHWHLASSHGTLREHILYHSIELSGRKSHGEPLANSPAIPAGRSISRR